MRTTLKSPASALAAIAAALALSATPAFAQDAASAPLDGPIVNVPPATTSPATTAPAPSVQAPAIVLPDVSPPATATSTTTAAPSTTAAPRAAATVARPAATSTATTTTTPRAAAAVRASAAGVTADTSSATIDAETIAGPEPIAAAEPVAIAPLAAEPVAEAAPTPTQTRDVTGMLALVLIGLIGLAIAAFALLAFRRRPAKAYRAAPVTSEPIVEPRPVAPQALAAAPIAPTMPLAAVTPTAPRNEPLATSGAAVALPARLPESYEERDALLKRMVAAKPDRANPFRSYKARVHRARLILQSLERKFERARPWIDLSQYSRNWPALARTPAYQAA